MPPKIISVIGGLDYDLIMMANRIPNVGESVLANEYLEAPGGKGANTALAAYRSCHQKPHDPRPIPAKGWTSDKPSDDAHRNVDMDAQLLSSTTSRDKIEVDVRMRLLRHDRRPYQKKNRCLFTHGATTTWGTEDFLRIEDLGCGMRPDICVAQMGIQKEVVEQMIETAECYKWVTHLIMNESEAAIMSGRELGEVNEDIWPIICQEFLSRGVKNVVITLGAQGAYYATATERGYCPGYDVEVVDSTGADDTFIGVYALECIRQKEHGPWKIEQAVARANKAAAIAILRLGAQRGIPWSDEIDKLDAPFRASKVADGRTD
ncbi:Ribokinase-like protein [Setomelanomma holmii]|uniref:Ribokinase-like protein n=1 Tax=Setomelanomma holmii TaxID=210430 RepID=A0A9P4H4X9_9PLEO|nr:Ribokinase-like protein [Setomelanomma holmii]